MEKRAWYKVKWVENPEPGNPKWDNIIGKTDLLPEESFEKYRQFVEVLLSVAVDKCKPGPALGFGKTAEEKIDKWIKENCEK